MSADNRKEEKAKRRTSRRKGKKPDAQAGDGRVTSITRRLHWLMIRESLFKTLSMDLLLAVTLITGWLADQEWTKTGSFLWKNSRSFMIEGNKWKDLVYRVYAPDGSLLFSSPCYPALHILFVIIGVLAAVQLMGFLFHYVQEDRKIRRIMSPLNELALKADELSRFTYSDDKYQVIEDAITHIQPGEDTPLSFGDSDLGGIEAAMNNLLWRMKESSRQQARFVNDASHELRTPIAVIQGYANMLSRWGKEDEAVLEESISAIRNEADHMNHLVEQLLFLARGDSGRTVLKKEDVNLESLMKEIYEESFMIDENHLYRLTGTDKQLHVQADAGLLKQAVRVLVDNAAKYTRAGDEIFLSWGREGGEVFLQVQDSGIGMGEADIQHMFERFFRADEARGYAGTGLGLSIAKWIVDRHKGHFEILSRPGLGTRIRILLPE